MKLKFTGRIENGQIILDDQHLFDKQKLSLEGKKVDMTLEKYKTQQSIPQLKFYWGVVIPAVCEYVGDWDREAVHYALKEMFLVARNSKGLKIIPSIRSLTTTESEIYVEKIRAWLAEEGIILPEPNQVDI